MAIEEALKGKWDDEKKRSEQAKQIAGNVLPKRDYPTMIAHDKTYYDALSSELEHKVIKLDILSKKCEKVEKTRQAISDNIDMLIEFVSLKRNIMDLKAKLMIQKQLLHDKENHYQYVFLPQYEAELRESEEHFEKTLQEAREVVSKEDGVDIHKEVINKLKLELEVFDTLTITDRKDSERKLGLYKPLKRLIGAYKKVCADLLEQEKYK